MDKIRVLVADDHALFREGIRLILESDESVEIVGEAADGRQATAAARALMPDVVLMDVTMPEMDGLEATRQIKAKYSQIQVLILTMHRSDEYFFEMLKAGASGYILKGAKTSELIDAVRAVCQGEVYLNPSMAQKLVQGYLNLVEWNTEDGLSLSPREKEILRLLAEGYSSKEIAEKLVVSSSTVHTHRSNLMSKLGLSTRRELMQYARQHGLTQD